MSCPCLWKTSVPRREKPSTRRGEGAPVGTLGRMRGREGLLFFTIRGANLAAPSSVTAFGRATFPLEGGRLLGACCYVVPFGYAFFRVRKYPAAAPIRAMGASRTNSHSHA